MTSKYRPFLRVLSAAICVLMLAQTAGAETYQYNVFVRGFGGPDAGGGTGIGAIDPGTDAVRAKLELSTDVMKFESLPAGEHLEQTRVLTNTGTGPAELSGIKSGSVFEVSSDCPRVLEPKAGCVIKAGFTPGEPGHFEYSMPIRATGMKVPASLWLTASVQSEKEADAEPPKGRLLATPDAVDFGNLEADVPGFQSLTLRNIGDKYAEISGLVSGRGFTVNHNCPAQLLPEAECTVKASFISAIGRFHAHTMKLQASPGGDIFPVTFYAYVQVNQALVPALTVKNGLLDFGAPDVDPSKTQTAFLTNEGTVPAELTGIWSTSNFKVGGDCPDELAIGATCRITARLEPTAVNGAYYAMNIRAQTGNPASVMLVGPKVPVDPDVAEDEEEPTQGALPSLVFQPAAATFGTLKVGQSAAQELILVNKGTAAANIATLSISGGAGFVSDTNCGSTLAPAESCAVRVTFEPAGPADVYAALVVTQSALPDTSATLSGRGEQALLVVGPASLSYGPMLPATVGDRVLSIQNGGNIPLTGLLVSKPVGPFSIVSNTCEETLRQYQGCSVTLRAAPPGLGNFSGSIQVSSSNGGAKKANLEGSVVKITANPTALGFHDTRVGVSAQDQSVAVTNGGPAPVSIQVGITANVQSYNQSNNCGTALESGAACSVTVRFTPSAEGANKGELGVAVGGLPVARVGLSGIGFVPRLTFAPPSLEFGDVLMGTESPAQLITVKNETQYSARLDRLALFTGGEDYWQTNDCGASLPQGASCTISVKMKPRSDVSRAGSLVLESSLGKTTALLSGRGKYLEMPLVGPATVSFGSLLPGTDATRIISFANNGHVPVGGVTVRIASGPFTLENNSCSGVVLQYQSCSVTVRATPTALGAFYGSLVASTASTADTAVQLTGSVVRISATPTSLLFPATQVGFNSPAQQVTLANTGLESVSLEAGMSLNPQDFNQSNNCGGPLAPGAKCLLSVQFSPVLEGELTGEVGVAVGNLPVVRISLAGTGFVPRLTLSSTVLSFGAINVGKTSAAIGLAVQNSTASTVQVTGVSVVGGNKDFEQSNSCGSPLPPGAGCAVSVMMRPVAEGARTGTLVLDSSLGQYSASLAGTGAVAKGVIDGTGDPVKVPGADPTYDDYERYAIKFLETEFGTVSAVRKVVFSNAGTGVLTVENIAVVSGDADFSQTNNCGSTIQPGGSCIISLTFHPSAAGLLKGGVAVRSDNGKYFFDMEGVGAAADGVWRVSTSASFGIVPSGSTAERSFSFFNAGTAAARNVATELSGQGLAFLNNSCGTTASPVKLEPGESCAVSVRYTPTSYGELVDAGITATGVMVKSPVTLALTGSAPAPVYTISGAAGSEGAPIVDNGLVPINRPAPISRTYYLRDNANLTAQEVTKVALTGNAAYSLESVDVVTYAGAVVSSCTLTASGVTANCKAGAKSRSIRVKVNLSPTVVGDTNSVLRIEHNGLDGFNAVSLTAKAVDLPSDPYFDKVIVLMHMETPPPGTTDFKDVKGNAVSNPSKVSTTPSGGVYGGSAMWLMGPGFTGDGVTVTSQALGADDFTIEFWISAGNGIFLDAQNKNGTGPALLAAGNEYVYATGSVSTFPVSNRRITGGYFRILAWHHMAVSRSNGVTRMFGDGVQVGADYKVVEYFTSNRYTFGRSLAVPSMNPNGAMTEVRITKGVGRYTKNFEVPTALFPNF